VLDDLAGKIVTRAQFCDAEYGQDLHPLGRVVGHLTTADACISAALIA